MELKIVTCPKCGDKSYFATERMTGFCSNCGSIMDCRSTEIATLSVESEDDSPKHTLTRWYFKESRYYNDAVPVEITGPVNKTLFVGDTKQEVILPEGQYQLVTSSHVSQGVHSTDVVNSLNINLNRNKEVNIRPKVGFMSFGIEIYER